jgi:uncharacterized membrane protein YgcG
MLPPFQHAWLMQDYRAALVIEEQMAPASSDGGLSAGIMAGIVVAGVVLLAVLCGALFSWCR